MGKGDHVRGLQPGEQGGYFLRVGVGKRKSHVFQRLQGGAVGHHALQHLAQLVGGGLLLTVDPLPGFPQRGVAVGLHGL
ncbi:hypothetical protein SAMN00120144_3885 [Hymenobacter roseosalivarius DSM 11622]|uniref:Uncharacterized protein n=1 Tax=Hymenobacter roseosalivarius DSM 11622 TaxID=645990 RepID=A0A1W1UGF0_9BACT|nr:hypothetical protein SAMN00120144_3885 [Hymenobacter roseosalivarius DSM 11622]